MKNDTGWFKTHRALREKAFYKNADRIRIFNEILMRANWRESEEMFDGKPIKCQPGEFTCSMKQLAESIGITESKAIRAVVFFEKIERLIERRTSSTNTLIRVLNWDKYQSNEDDPERRNESPLSDGCKTTVSTIRIQEDKKSKSNTFADANVENILSIDKIKKEVKPRTRKATVRKEIVRTPFTQLGDWLIKNWMSEYPKPVQLNKIWAAIGIGIKNDITEEDGRNIIKKIKAHTSEYIANTEPMYVCSAATYIETRKWNTPVVKKKVVHLLGNVDDTIVDGLLVEKLKKRSEANAEAYKKQLESELIKEQKNGNTK